MTEELWREVNIVPLSTKQCVLMTLRISSSRRRTPFQKDNGKVRVRLTFGLLVYRRKRGGVTTLDGSKRENEMRRNPKESIKGFVRGKNYEALVVSPPKGFEIAL